MRNVVGLTCILIGLIGVPFYGGMSDRHHLYFTPIMVASAGLVLLGFFLLGMFGREE